MRIETDEEWIRFTRAALRGLRASLEVSYDAANANALAANQAEPEDRPDAFVPGPSDAELDDVRERLIQFGSDQSEASRVIALLRGSIHRVRLDPSVPDGVSDAVLELRA